MSYMAFGIEDIVRRMPPPTVTTTPLPSPPPAAPPLTLASLLVHPVVLSAFKPPVAPVAPATAPAAAASNAWNVPVRNYDPTDSPSLFCKTSITKTWLSDYWVQNQRNCGTVITSYWNWVRSHPGWTVPPLTAAAYQKDGVPLSKFQWSSSEESPQYPMATYLAGIVAGTIPPPPTFPLTKLAKAPSVPPAAATPAGPGAPSSVWSGSLPWILGGAALLVAGVVAFSGPSAASAGASA